MRSKTRGVYWCANHGTRTLIEICYLNINYVVCPIATHMWKKKYEITRLESVSYYDRSQLYNSLSYAVLHCFGPVGENTVC
jgi:hypothetical protein